MSRDTPDQIIAHVDLLRAVDRMLAQAEVVRTKREVLAQLLSDRTDDGQSRVATGTEVSHGR